MLALLNQRQAAAILRLSERTLERMRVAGNGPAYVKVGRRVLYQQEAIQEFVASRVVRSTSEAGSFEIMNLRSGEDQRRPRRSEFQSVTPRD